MPDLKQNIKYVDPNLRDLLDLHKKEIMLGMNCHAIAEVQSFNKENQTIEATLVYTKTFIEKQSAEVYVPIQKQYPILVDVPVIILGGGPFNLTMAPEKGDTCLILFNDRDIDNWFEGSSVGPVASARLHSFSDGVALVGLNSKAKSISDFDDDRAVLRSREGTVALGVTKEDLIVMENELTSLKTVMGNLLTAIAGITTINCVVGAPVTLNPASIAAIEQVRTEMETLLE